MQIVFRIFSVIAFPSLIIIAFLTLIISPSSTPAHYYLLWSFPIFIIINWIAWGMWGGIIAGLATAITTIYSWIFTENTGYLLENILIIILLVLLYIYELRIKNSITNLNLNQEHSERSYNLLLQKYKKQEVLRESYYKKAKRFTRLSQIAKDLGFSLTPEEINRRIINNLTKTIEDGDIYQLWGVEIDLQSLALKAMESPSGLRSPESIIHSDEFNLWTMRHRQPLLVANIAKDYRFNPAKILSTTNTKSLIISPLITGNKIMGIVRIDSFKAEAFSIDDLRLLAIIANLSALTIYNANLFKETEYLATRDSLTGLYVKRFLREKLEKLLAKTKITGETFSVLLIDLDKFKKLNDQFGHSVGDKVLQKVSQIIEEEAGPNSIPARYGGEEFAVLLPDTTKPEAKIIAEKIRKQIEKETFSVRREGLHTTISVGAAELSGNEDSPDVILDKADKALYQAKHKGRNCVVVA